jgi:hypothetical protein
MSESKSAEPFDPANLVLPGEYFKARQVAGKNNQRLAKSLTGGVALKFYKLPAQLDRDLINAKTNWAVWAMVRALYEAWFAGGYPNHPNPFPLRLCDTKKWGLSRMQKHRSLEFLVKTGWILVDKSDPKNPSVTLTWQPRY